MKLLSLFSGIGSFEKALDNLKINYDLVNYCEIDKYASCAYSAIHNEPEEKNLWDVREVNPKEIDNFDLMTWGFPCTDISLAGKQKGLKEGSGTKSSLLWEGMRILKAKKPKYSIVENVKNLIQSKFVDDFKDWISDMEKTGYNNYWKVMNAKHWGIPQNRERVFVVSIRKDVDNGSFKFPISSLEKQMSLFNDNVVKIESKVLQDILQDEVREKYYLSDTAIEKLERHSNDVLDNPLPQISSTIHAGYFKMGGRDQQYVGDLEINKIGNIYPFGGQNGNIYNSNGISPALRSGQGDSGRGVGSNNSPKLLELKKLGGWVNGEFIKNPYKSFSQAQRIYATDGVSVSLTGESGGLGGKTGLYLVKDREKIKCISCNQATIHKYRIRKLTPLECWRLMDFYDEDYWTARKALEKEFYNGNDRSDTQMYKMAGNSIVVKCLEEIFKVLFNYS